MTASAAWPPRLQSTVSVVQKAAPPVSFRRFGEMRNVTSCLGRQMQVLEGAEVVPPPAIGCQSAPQRVHRPTAIAIPSSARRGSSPTAVCETGECSLFDDAGRRSTTYGKHGDDSLGADGFCAEPASARHAGRNLGSRYPPVPSQKPCRQHVSWCGPRGVPRFGGREETGARTGRDVRWACQSRVGVYGRYRFAWRPGCQGTHSRGAETHDCLRRPQAGSLCYR